VAHVADGGSDDFVLVADVVVELFIGGVGAGDEVVLVEVGVIGARCVGEAVPKPLKADCDRNTRLWRWRFTARIIYRLYSTLFWFTYPTLSISTPNPLLTSPPFRVFV
jgi:hypothetical protein